MEIVACQILIFKKLLYAKHLGHMGDARGYAIISS